MNGLASPAARRSATPESASRSRPESAARAPAREAAVAVAPVPAVAPAQMQSTRARMQASFGAAEPAAPSAGGEALAVVPPVAESLTTRDRIVNRALAAPEDAGVAAVPEAAVVDLADARDRRREPRSETELAPAASRRSARARDRARSRAAGRGHRCSGTRRTGAEAGVDRCSRSS